MSLTSRIANYRDVESMLAAAVPTGGGRVTFPSPSAASRFRSRIYRYLQLLEGTNPEYDAFSFTLDGPVVVVAPVKFAGKFEDLNGNPIPVEEAPLGARAEPTTHIPPDDDLLIAALELRRSMERKPE